MPASVAWHDRRVHTILIVDDHPTFRSQARALLEADGFLVVGEAGDGSSGLAAVLAFAPELVLLDIGLPDIDGFEVSRKMASIQPAPPDVVLTSSREASSFGARVADSGALGFLPKDELSGAAIRALLKS